ncbi:MAG TPA: RodZ domain-containing protein [Burkholderiales bacterium]|nr:RodZ domain-containing protein [Burkholderiales bacterium]
MSDTPEARSVSAEDGPGRRLARLRAERKLSVADVAQRLKYGARQIEALESEEFDRLPGATFVRGMVRGYAKLLETDPEPILGALEQRYVPGEISLDLRAKRVPFAPGGKRSGTRNYLLLSLVVLVVAGLLYEWRAGAFPWARLASSTAPAQKQAKPRPAPVPASHAEPETPASPAVVVAEKPAAGEAPAPRSQQQASAGEIRVRLEFEGESWVEIKDGEGKMLMSQLNPSGSRRVVSGRAPMALVIGNAANVRLIYKDKPVDLKPYIQIEVARLTLD